ncbi:Gfo/Idh/MocA family protein [Dactylosporangium sp. CA-233914]|uniref:Gfo/Idh/MocA family protein n=1 Tax=Dactylosporangium sp. CA-233914 TaxID=3239934 RepID=UPI003D8B63FF
MTLRIGLVGAGAVAGLHVQAAAQLPGIEVAAVCDIKPEAARRLAGMAGAEAYTDVTQMLASGLDAVIIMVPHALHAPMALQAAEHGVHILMEKPMATELADCQRMIDACARNHVCLAVGHVQRYLPDVRLAQEFLASGRIGAPVLIHNRRSVRYESGTRPDWFFDPVLAGGGVVMNIGTHAIDRSQFLAGSPARTVHARTWRRPGFDVETDMTALIQMANEVTVTVTVTSTGMPPGDETQVICEDGALRMSHDDGLWWYQRGQANLLLAPDEAHLREAFRLQLADFAACCAAGIEPASGGSYGQSVVAAATAMYRSAATGETVPVSISPWQVPA